jgi:hypothetical protein
MDVLNVKLDMHIHILTETLNMINAFRFQNTIKSVGHMIKLC